MLRTSGWTVWKKKNYTIFRQTAVCRCATVPTVCPAPRPDVCKKVQTEIDSRIQATFAPESQGTLARRASLHTTAPAPAPGGHASTFLGSSWFARFSPWPRQLCSPSPQLQTAPSAVMAKL